MRTNDLCLTVGGVSIYIITMKNWNGEAVNSNM